MIFLLVMLITVINSQNIVGNATNIPPDRINLHFNFDFIGGLAIGKNGVDFFFC